MARTMDLTGPCADFKKVLADGESAWLEAESSKRRKTVAEDIFLRFVVGWESFVSEWFIGAVNHDATRFRRNIERKMDNWLRDAISSSPYARYGPIVQRPALTLAKVPQLARVRELLDPSGRNIEFSSFDDFLHRSGEQLASKYSAKVGLVKAAGGDEIVDAAAAIRNVLAHRSQKSVRIMNEQIGSFATYSELRKTTMSKDGIGTYLVAKTAAGEARLRVFRRELDRIVDILLP